MLEIYSHYACPYDVDLIVNENYFFQYAQVFL